MTKNGINHPEVVDLVANSDSETILIIVQTESLESNSLSNLQEKINNYLSFAKDGQLYENYPEANGKELVIRLEYYESIDSATLGFFEKVADVLAVEKVKFMWVKCEY